MNGDPLHEGKLDLPELLEVPTPREWAWARDFIARRKWCEATTYPKTAPHEYTVREWEAEGQANQDFDQFTTFVRRFGYADFCGFRKLWPHEFRKIWPPEGLR